MSKYQKAVGSSSSVNVTFMIIAKLIAYFETYTRIHYTYIHACMHIYIHICLHTYSHAHIHT